MKTRLEQWWKGFTSGEDCTASWGWPCQYFCQRRAGHFGPHRDCFGVYFASTEKPTK